MSSDIQRHTPLTDFGQDGVPTIRLQGVTIRENPFQSYFNIRLDATASDRFGEVFQCNLPVEQNTYSTAEGVTCMWLRSDEWMLIADDKQHGAITEKLNQVCADAFATWTDQTSANTSLSIRGKNSVELLSRGVVFDLHPTNFPRGKCVRTVLSHTQVSILNRTVDDTPEFELLVRRSFADYLWRWLLDKGEEAYFSTDRTD